MPDRKQFQFRYWLLCVADVLPPSIPTSILSLPTPECVPPAMLSSLQQVHYPLQSGWVLPRLTCGHHVQRIAVARLQPRLVHEVKAAHNLAVLIGPCLRKCARSQQCHIHMDCLKTTGTHRSSIAQHPCYDGAVALEAPIEQTMPQQWRGVPHQPRSRIA